jgi:hypothetical protein
MAATPHAATMRQLPTPATTPTPPGSRAEILLNRPLQTVTVRCDDTRVLATALAGVWKRGILKPAP